ncbi:ecdysone receptor-like protein [Dinothrombium tinctorium]|uniref:Ecdysone receptor-like protein n=1 Tax=Dinothrombium tinctorium TaxID=1965070 RepID=A0A3S4QVX7_9ACAR|nr:ecdysone receptor-like protein [Dinothrombium tinctorium]
MGYNASYSYGQNWFAHQNSIHSHPNTAHHSSTASSFNTSLPLNHSLNSHIDQLYFQNGGNYPQNYAALPMFSQCYTKKSFMKHSTAARFSDFERRFLNSQRRDLFTEIPSVHDLHCHFTSNLSPLENKTEEVLIPTVISDQSSSQNSSSPQSLVIDDNAQNQPEADFSVGDFSSSPEEVVCGVCSGPASGRHYNAITCEGCKGFFRRVVINGSFYRCERGGNCTITMKNRRKSCRGCRFQKCLDIGMKRELCLRHTRNGRKRTVDDLFEEEQTWKDLQKQIDVSYQSTIHSFVCRFYAEISNIQSANSDPLADLREKFVINLEMECNAMVSGIGLFRQLSYYDQNCMIKNCIDDMTLLHICKHYNYSQRSIRWPSGHYMNGEELKLTKLAPIADQILKLAQLLYDLNPSLSEYALMTSLRFASANGVRDHFKGIYDQVFQVFKEYCFKYRSNDSKFIERAMQILEFTKCWSKQFYELIWVRRNFDQPLNDNESSNDETNCETPNKRQRQDSPNSSP